MGCTFRKAAFEAIPDNYHSVGLQSSDLIIGVDFTESNLVNTMSKNKGVYVTLTTQWKGKETFEGRSLHYIDPTGRVVNPYQRVLSTITRVFELFDDDHSIPAFGYGGHLDRPLNGRYFSFLEGGRECDLDEILQQYFALASSMSLTAPASFVPVIYEAIERVKMQFRYHILILVTNGHVEEPAAARRAIVDASAYPLSIVMIGVGDGPWTLMQEFDDKVPERIFDNVQFVNYNTIPRGRLDNPDAGFAMQALMELPGR
ncbi:hypothetical protein PsorP6_016431 [Peronosclerospora sorghi]|uniref:Uncharacterized protein n=1 Tax=Peronosclerospora sorghi TaxID=230839 RepID=A0ACC0VPY1_9STRA|nr:hypothetical protein PsorP6_016431 [Peronosclerospora sorghi]